MQGPNIYGLKLVPENLHDKIQYDSFSVHDACPLMGIYLNVNWW